MRVVPVDEARVVLIDEMKVTWWTESQLVD